MSDDEPNDEPDWDLLPDRPEAFFRLEGEYERRDLKRAYTRLIKRYKPERHPDEFRRIRAAYEVLDERLRYGTTTPFTGNVALDLPDAARSETRRPRPDVVQVDAVALLREHGPKGARERLRAAAEDDAAAWARLALIDDVLDEDPLRPFLTLLEGIRSSQGHPAPVNLLASLLHEEIDPKIAARVMVELARAAGMGALPATLFWFLTDYQWTHLACVVKFDSFAKLLDRCIDEVGEDGRPAQIVLMLRLRRRAVLRADDEWLARVDGEILESLQRMPPWAEYDYDTADWLTAYRGVREAFVDGSDIRDIFDDALAAIVAGDDVNADRTFLLAKNACFERTDELFDSFGNGDAVTGTAAAILHWYGDEWRERQGVEEEEPRVGYRKAVEFSRRLHRRSQRSIIGRVWNFTIVLSLLVVIGILLGVTFVLVEAIGNGALVLPIAAVIGAIAGFQRGWFARPVRWISQPFMKRQHRTLWRPMAMEFFDESRLPFQTLISVLQGEEDSPTGPFVLEALASDHGLALYSNAVRTLD